MGWSKEWENGGLEFGGAAQHAEWNGREYMLDFEVINPPTIGSISASTFFRPSPIAPISFLLIGKLGAMGPKISSVPLPEGNEDARCASGRNDTEGSARLIESIALDHAVSVS